MDILSIWSAHIWIAEIIQSCKEKHYHPKLKRTIPPGVRPYFIEEIAEAMQGAEIIVSGVNSLGVHWIAKTIGPLLRPGQMLMAVTKGLEVDAQGNLIILPDVLASELPAESSGSSQAGCNRRALHCWRAGRAKTDVCGLWLA